jgi:signal transduction histidine kinase
MDLAAACGHLALAVLIGRASGPRILRWTLVALCLDMFGWNFATLAHAATGSSTWHHLDLILSPLTVPIGLHAVIAFAGRHRTLRRWLTLGYATGVALSLVSVGAFFSPACARWADSAPWALAFLGLLIPATAANVSILVLHLRVHRDREERARGWLMLSAVVAGTLVGSSELLKGFVSWLPGLGSLGSLLITLPTAIAFLRYELFSQASSGRVAAYVTVLTALTVVFCAVLLTGVGEGLSVGVFAAGLVGVPLAWALRELAVDLTARRERARYLTRVGRMVEQMAHDLRTPAASLKAAIQYVQVQQQRGLDPSTLTTYLDLMRGQVERVGDIIDRYLRLARVVPSIVEVDINSLVAGCAKRNPQRVRASLAPGLPKIWADPDLLTAALDNLVDNALDASSPGVPVTLRTEVHDQAAGPVVEISVEDHGRGMDPRQMELAFEELFTTKPGGSGLGLSFAHRVLEAHGGTVLLRSAVGRGTTATVRLPASDARHLP